MKPLSGTDGLIVCFGENVADLCTNAVPQIAACCPDLNPQFVMSDWLAEDQLRRAAVFWVLDTAAGLNDLRIAFQYGIALLVPEQSQLLRKACVEGNCGLFYQNHEEAIACLIYLLRNPATRRALGENARRFSELDTPGVQTTGDGR